jgi:dTDP-4-amino-4,6-dideoxygalactose transaminase
MIPFNKPFIGGKESEYIQQAIASGKLAGDGVFTKKCQGFFEEKYKFGKCLLTTSCTDALEMAAILIDIKEGDEVIIPSYTFVSSANPFILRGAKIVFADSRKDFPGIDEDSLEKLITPKTKAIIPIHYAGIACDMDKIMTLANKYQLYVIEDAAQAIDSYYTFPDGRIKPLGSIAHLSAFSFHETKNLTCGEGGMLVINDFQFAKQAEIVREKGTNRSAFFRGEVDKYGWVSMGSSFLSSEILAAFLWGQLENLENVQTKRKAIWNRYWRNLKKDPSNFFQLPYTPCYATNNGHMFYIVFNDEEQRRQIIESLKQKNISTVFHYLSLHKSQFFQPLHDGRVLPESDRYSNALLRLPFFFDLTDDQIDLICDKLVEECRSLFHMPIN